MLSRLQGLLGTIFLSVAILVNAQDDHVIHFPSGDAFPDENIQTYDFNDIPQEYRYADGFYTFLQFNEIPTQDQKEAMEALGIQFPEYLPYKTYLAFIPSSISSSELASYNARAIVPINSEKKISHTLINQPYGDWAIVGNQILVILQRHKQVSNSEMVTLLNQQGVQVIESHEQSRNMVIQISESQIESIAQLVEVRWMELVQEPGVPEDTDGRGLHRSNAIDRNTPMGRHWTGEGVNVLCRDDGTVGPHIDFEGRIRNLVNDPTGTHGDGISGIMSGAGNLNPSMRGMAAGSFLYVVQYGSSFLDAPTLNVIADSSVVITNSSYSDGCNAGYTSGTQTVDSQIHNDTDLLHVFSAGNSNGACSTYGAGSQWGNITGGHKQGKNCMTTANLFDTGGLVGSSSRGPAHDGRIKPDISAHGQGQGSTSPNNGYQSFGGTSAAAPGIAGISAQLYHGYKELNGGNNPESALIKAAILNTANDLGNVGPDYKFGWGHVNSLRAAMLIEEERYLDDNISQGNINSHIINVPAGTQQVRFMLYWNDPEASPGANPALVNDLDIVVKDPANTSFLPYVLDETPNATTLDLPATNGIDNLNNMEQVLFDLPTAGDYTVEVTGTGVPIGPQHYFVVYEIIEDAISFTYPIGGESFTPNTNEIIHWDAYNLTNSIEIEYSSDNGNSWNTINSVSASTRLFTWFVPSNFTGSALLRATSGSETATTPDNFSVAPKVTGIMLTEVCPNDITLEWDAIGPALAYDVFMLGDKYMDSVATTNTNSITFTPPMDPTQGFYYSVRARGLEGWTGLRTVAQHHIGGAFNCVVTNDVGVAHVINPLPGAIFNCSNNEYEVSVRLINEGLVDESNVNVTYQLDNETPIVEVYSWNISSR